MPDVSSLSVTEIVKAVRSGRLTATAVMEAFLDRVRLREEKIHAFANFSADQALSEAAAVDGRIAGGADLSLMGVPIGVKDVLDTGDRPTGYGSPIWAGHRPKADASCVALARRAGASVIGKTVTAEFAVRHPGPTRNPHNLDRTPGGSSSGSAAGVAAEFFPASLCTQTVGSIIRPAAFCGVVGFKPTKGMIHRGGMRVMSEAFDTIGVIAKTVPDCAAVVTAICGVDLGNPGLPPDRMPRIAVCVGHDPSRADSAARALLERVASAASQAGAVVDELVLPREIADAPKAHLSIYMIETARALAWEIDNAADEISTTLMDGIEAARAAPEGAYERAFGVLRRARKSFNVLIEPYDAIITLSAPGEAPYGIESTGDPVFNILWSALGGPCVTVPAGRGPNGMPLGIQIVAPSRADHAALMWAEWVRHLLD